MKPLTPPPLRRGRNQRRAHRLPFRHVAAVVAVSLIPGLLTPVAFAATVDPLGKPELKAPTPQSVSRFTGKLDKKSAALLKKAAETGREDAVRAKADQAKSVSWPTAGTATITVPSAGAVKASPGALPVTLTSPKPVKKAKSGKAAGSVKVNVLDQRQAAALGVKGVVLTVTGPANGGATELGIDYGKFASAYGGDWAGRLQVLRLQDCALKNPASAKCRTRTPMAFNNHRKNNRIDADLSFKPAATVTTRAAKSAAAPAAGQTMVLALAAGTQSSTGDYKATPLASSSTWEAGGSSGSFTWSYPLRVPPSAAGPRPGLTISYDSGSVDGRTANTNNQGSTVGEGFDITSSYVERKYGSCDDDGQTDKFDLCWKYENASLVLNGKATELVKDDTSGKWRLKNDDASTVIHSTGAENGDDDGESWTVITGEGTKYVFGLNKLDGAPAGERTQSVWTVPVFGDDSGEPGYADGTSFAGRDKKQAWRWNLDYVEETHGNAMSYWYTAEENNYDRLGDDTTGTLYTRGGYLREIRYGQRAGALFTGSPAASNKVVFDYKERCIQSGTGCSNLDPDTRDNWPDVPLDAICQNDAKCTGNTGPSFFTRKRMTAVTTYAWEAAAATPAFTPVDQWALTQAYLDPGDTGDSSDQSLWLDEIRHTGMRGTPITLDPVKFDHEFRANRVDGAQDNILPLHKPRLYTITSETGSATIVNYLQADCLAGQARPKLDENTRRCYPVYWSPNGEKDPILDWFHKYPVEQVSTTDPKGGSSGVSHTYSYSGAGWHYNEDPLVKEKERTWSIWRGFEKVTHLTGMAGKTQSKTATVYMRGMDGDRLLGTDGKTPDPTARKTAHVTGIKAPAITDSGQYAGFTRETVTYNGAQEVTGAVNDPWSQRTATQHKSYADTEAYYIRTGASHARTNITTNLPARDRVRSTVTTYDAYGMATNIEDKGDDGITGDEQCSRIWYARNDAAGINSLVSRTRVTGKPCAITGDDLNLPADSTVPGDVISDDATAYDTTTWSSTQTPTKGEARWTGRAKGYTTANNPVWQKLATTTYDTLGRPLTVKDTNDTTAATTTYTPAATGPTTRSTVGNAKGHTTTTLVDFATGAALKVTDTNGKITESEYDSLGRVTKTWLPNRSKGLGKTPNYVYDYSVTASDLPWVSTAVLKGDGSGYNTTYEIYDNLLRPRQTQAPSPRGGSLIALNWYDERGLAISAQSDIWDDDTAPSGTLVGIDGGQAPMRVDTTYDGAGRAIKAETKVGSVTRWTIDTAYTGDTVTTTAPAGGQATAVVTNALGQTTQRREYGGTQPIGDDYTSTNFTYFPTGQQETVAGPDQAKWIYKYDLFGRQTSASDPDKGTSTTTYNALDQVNTATDSRGRILTSEYDVMGRKTGLWDTSTAAKTDANKLAAWTFDTLAKGQQDTAVRYENGFGQPTSKAYTQKIDSYDAMYQPTGTSLTLPDNDPLVTAGVPKTLSTSAFYNLDGTPKQNGSPAVAGLPSETVEYKYGALGQLTYSHGTTDYVQAAAYSPQGDLLQLSLGVSPTAKKAYLNYAYEDGTRRLTNSWVSDDVHSYLPQELKFTQDDAGNVTSIFDTATLGGTSKPDYQCFANDGHRRMTQAWTPKTADCAASGRTMANIDGAAPYWTTYTYTPSGQRKTETQHMTTGDKTTNYAYGTATGQPHPLANTTGAKAANYTYDKAGNTTNRPGTQAQQTLAWNAEGKLVSTTEPAAGSKPALGTSYLYDASGELLIRRPTTTDGDTVLYLGGTEVRLTTKGTTKTLSGTRYYTAAGQTIAVRAATVGVAGTRLSFLAADHHGTSSVALDATTLAVTKRYSSPFGAARGTAATAWPDDKGFLGKPADTKTGMTHIGAREYDPGIGQFISVDLVMVLGQHQSLNGYAYANNTPVTFSDPTGLCIDPGNGHCTPDDGGKLGDQEPDHESFPPLFPTGSDTGSGDTNGTASGDGDEGDVEEWLLSFGPSTDDETRLSQMWMAYYRVDGGSYWDTPVGDGDRTANACYGRLGCAAAYKHLLETGDVAGAKKIAATYCLNNAEKCASDAVGYKATQTFFAALPGIVAAARGARLAGAGCNKCFLAGTEVLMADGTTKNIEDVELGDQVLATDPETGESGPREVTRLIVTEDDKHFNTLTIEASEGTEELTATHEHPFWSPSEGRWVEAAKLTRGMTLLTDDGTTVTVTGNHAFTKHARTYNLTVEDLHTYYVLAGQTPVLVHNSNCSIGSVTGPAGETLPLPKGAAGTPVATGKGGAYDIPAGTKGLDPRVVQVRVMDPVTTGKYQYPNGYVVYMNKAGQSVNPLTGQTVGKADPYNHIPIP
ncbi:type IV secretion protein Rhs [Streptomyces lunaelactis]|uniref:Type IV secretion protein Rhs n=1 Tax=Streptomyces lunaelactis TaxID=1535768 RepID=A0A2R4TAQ2_9ACTN|nr:polymorphic toxin-type HINT domain-containing protein [Streptomyces lunaelactis]AVZ76213.1 type IV secretion protein Rhs [Streptomyces lunaelactis]